MRRAARFLTAAVIAICLGSPALAGTDSDFRNRFGDAFFQEYWRYNTDKAIAVGYYRVADRLVVPDGRERSDYLRFLDRWLARLRSVDRTHLDSANLTDLQILENQLASERWQATVLREWEWNPALYNVAEPFAVILDTPYAPLDRRLRAVLSRLKDVPAYFKAAEAGIRNPTHEHTVLAIEQNEGALEVFGGELERKIAASGLSAGERALFVARTGAARRAIEDYIAWLKALDLKQGTTGARSFRLGRTLYDRKFLYDNQSGETAENVFRRAQDEKARVLDRMERLADELWPKYFAANAKPGDRFAKIAQILAKLSENHVQPAGYIPAIRGLIPNLEQFVTGHDLIDLDPGKPLEVRETPAYERGVAIAGVEAPGPYDPGARTYFNVDPLDRMTPAQAESFLSEYNNWMLPVFIIHEAIPGHYVQLLYANRSPSRIKSIFGNGAMIEGWAVYCERMMLESGYGGGAPELWLMYWKWYLRSVVNTVLDYSVHVLGMSEDDAKTMLVREAFQSEKEAEGKWLRVQRSSVQLTQYYSGFSAIYGLRERLRQQPGGRFDLKRFHKRLLSYGSAPVRLIEQSMSAEPR